LASWTPDTDDAKVWAMLQAALTQLQVDKKRVHFMGFSQGGWMTWRMLCAHADVFASVAPGAGCSFAGTEGCSFSAKQKPAVEVPVLYMHGTKDILQSFACGAQQRDAVVAGWKMSEVGVVSQDSKHLWTRYQSPKGTVFEFIQHDWAASSFLLVGHCYPGSTDQSAKLPGQIAGFGCKPPNAFAWGEAAMQFFVAHPKP
jgi:polyhydroxybutyrate depolymerase